MSFARKTHQSVLGNVEVPITYSPEEAVGLMQEAGIVGAGGAAFPTYVKYKDTPQALAVNAAESEPGYYADKLLHRDEPEAFVNVFEWMKATFSMEFMLIIAEEVAKPYLEPTEKIAGDLHSFSISYIPSKYKYGQEKALLKAALGVEVPKKQIPPEQGFIVNNTESVFNIYRAVFRERPVITKFMHFYGEIDDKVNAYEVPVGALAHDLFEIAGVDARDYKDCLLYDGGPILNEKVADPIGKECLAPVTRSTNALLVVHPDKDKQKRKHYPHPDYEHNSIDAPWAPDRVVNLEEDIHRVRIPYRGKFQTPGRIHVDAGDEVVARQTIVDPGLDGFSVGVHASIDGKVTKITDEWIEIVRQ
jgi:Na+-translocating ferredoxin:NAD+ oxidoreductase subunit C